MQLEGALLDPIARIVAACLALPAYAAACATAPWRTWLDRPDRQHVWLGSIVLLLIVWSLRAGITPGLTLQFLLVSALTLMHGWSLAVVAAGVVLGADCLQHGDAAAWPANLLCCGIVPASCTALVHRVVGARLPRNYFVFFFVTVFAGSITAFNLAGAARLGLLWLSGTLPATHVADEYVVLLPMMSLAEAFLNGVVIAIAVVYAPQWVRAFDDRLYLRR